MQTKKATQHLLAELSDLGVLKTLRIAEALSAVPREFFVPSSLSLHATKNIPLPLPSGGTISQPMIFSLILELAYLQKGNKVLVYDTGSGWEASVVAWLLGIATEEDALEGAVVCVSGNETLSNSAARMARNAQFPVGNGFHFLPKDNEIVSVPFDRIISLYSPDAEKREIWKRNLAIGGRIVAPRDAHLWVCEKKGSELFEEKNFFGFHFPTY
jgi:protein-L-isoaspartate(D-aspartate) O-methyltransferase